MSLYQITFSPTGGTQALSALVAQAFPQKPRQVDLTEAGFDFGGCRFTPEDLCIVAVPSFGGRVPGIAVSRLKQMAGGGARAILLAAYGNRAYEDTLLELRDCLLEAGFRCVAAVSAVAEHSIVRSFAVGRPDAEDRLELEAFAEKIASSMESGTASDPLCVPGNLPYREYKGVPMKPTADEGCTRCGLCAARCPVGAIPAEAPGKTDEAVCISCMRCVSVCPQKARAVNPMMVAAAAKSMEAVCSSRKQNELFL